MSVVLYFSRSTEVIHELTVSKSVNLGLGGLLGNGENEFSGIFYSRLVIMTTYLVEIASASCVYVMNHVMPAFLVRPKRSLSEEEKLGGARHTNKCRLQYCTPRHRKLPEVFQEES